jgi:hypothetical protein
MAIAAILLCAALSAAVLLWTDSQLINLLRAHRIRLFLVILLALVFRIPREGPFFHGLEYEDSYVYTAAARHLLSGGRIGQTPYLTSLCSVGSIAECRNSETYSGHFVGYPYAIVLTAKAIGYGPYVGNVVSIVSGCVGLVLVFAAVVLITSDPLAATLAAATLAMTPVFCTFGTSSSAEPFSSVWVSLLLLLFIRYCGTTTTRRHPRWSTWPAAVFGLNLVAAALVKRENLLVGLVPLAVALSGAVRVPWGRPGSRRAVAWSLAVVGALAFGLFVMDLNAVIGHETAEYARFPFSLSFARALLPAFFRSFSQVEWYGPTFALVLAGAARACWRRDLGLYPFATLCAFILVYATHVRSYYFIQAEPVTAGDAVRYSMNLMGVWAVAAGYGATFLTGWVSALFRSAKGRAGLWIFGGLTAFVSYATTDRLRADLIDEELRIRIKPAMVAARIAEKTGSPVVTLEPLLVQIYAPISTKVLALYDLDAALLAQMKQEGVSEFILLEHNTYNNPADARRYANALKTLRPLAAETIYTDENCTIRRLTTR